MEAQLYSRTAEMILLCVRWYWRFSLNYRNLEEMMVEHRLSVDHTTIYRWVQQYAPELEKLYRPLLKTTPDSWKVDETSIEVRKMWMYLYRAVDSEGRTLEFPWGLMSIKMRSILRPWQRSKPLESFPNQR